MWSQSQSTDVPERQVFQTFTDRRKKRTRNRVIFLLVLVAIVLGGYYARPHFPGAEAAVRRGLGKVLHVVK
jgi:hypothetical protein